MYLTNGKDHCGVVAICHNQACTAKKAGQALFHLQHRGSRSVGLGVLHKSEKTIVRGVCPGLVKANQNLFEQRPGDSAIGHVSLKEPQPFFAGTRMGPIGLAFSGSIINAARLRDRAMEEGRPFTTKDDVEVLANLVGRCEDPVSGLKNMAEQAKGSFSAVLLTGDGAFAARDPLGFKPLILGRDDNGCAAASESAAITEIGMKIIRDVKPGEIVFLDHKGPVTVGRIASPRQAYCAFEWAYTARIDSTLEGVPVAEARFKLGASLARHDDVRADLVSPIPMSGIGCAEGYASLSGVPYRNVFYFNRFVGRSYAPLEQAQRDIIAALKLSPIGCAIKGKRLIICVDAIVRGTKTQQQIPRLRAAGAKEIHIRVAAPQHIGPCRYGISTRSHDELIARRHSLEKIQNLLGADSLKYNSPEDFVAAIGLPKEQLCLACFTGEYPL